MLLQQHSIAAVNRAEKASKEGEWSGQEAGGGGGGGGGGGRDEKSRGPEMRNLPSY